MVRNMAVAAMKLAEKIAIHGKKACGSKRMKHRNEL